MKSIEFFNLMPQEVLILSMRFTAPGRSLLDVAHSMSCDENIIQKNENLAMCKIKIALKNCGVMVTTEGLQKGLLEGTIGLTEIVNNSINREKECDGK